MSCYIVSAIGKELRRLQSCDQYGGGRGPSSRRSRVFSAIGGSLARPGVRTPHPQGPSSEVARRPSRSPVTPFLFLTTDGLRTGGSIPGWPSISFGSRRGSSRADEIEGDVERGSCSDVRLNASLPPGAIAVPGLGSGQPPAGSRRRSSRLRGPSPSATGP